MNQKNRERKIELVKSLQNKNLAGKTKRTVFYFCQVCNPNGVSVSIYKNERNRGSGNRAVRRLGGLVDFHFLEKWEKPSNYVGAEWPDYYVFLGRNRDSDLLTETNFDIGLERIGGESETVMVIRESHWAVGWVEWIAIHQLNFEALGKAEEILKNLNDHPFLDEESFREREMEEAEKVWLDHFDYEDRINFIRENLRFVKDEGIVKFKDILSCVRGKGGIPFMALVDAGWTV